jgi:hypothetical protein
MRSVRTKLEGDCLGVAYYPSICLERQRNHENLSGYPITRQRFEPDMFLI